MRAPMSKNDKNFIYDKNRQTFVYNDGVTADKENIIDNFYLYYGWVCEKVDNPNATYTQWKEALGFLSIEKYRAYVEKDELRIRLLEIGMLIYITRAIDTGDKKICILGFRQAVRWGYVSVIMHGKTLFNDENRYLRFLYKISKRYFIESTIKSNNLEVFYKVNRFDEFLFSLMAISLNKKTDLINFGTESMRTDKKLLSKDSEVEWDWLMNELKKAKNKSEYKKLLNVLHIALNDYINFELNLSSKGTFKSWKIILADMEKSEKDWVKELVKEENVLFKKMKKKYKSITGSK